MIKFVLIISLCLFSFFSFADTLFFNDPLYNRQWALKNNGQVVLRNISELERFRVEGAPGQDISWIDTSYIKSSKKEIVVAVLDTGLDVDHPDLVGRVWYNKDLCFNALDPVQLACTGFNFLDNNNNVSDDVGHGTHIAGIIAANRNSIGIVGAADSRIKIMPLKILNSKVNGFVYNGKLITDVIADAMLFAIKNGAEVINLSLGWPKLIDTEKVRQAFQLAEEKNIIVIAGSGNNNKNLPTFPCSYENVICVGAVDNRGELAPFSNFGSKIDLAAPGEGIVSTFPKKIESRVLRISNYEIKNGSSQSAPFVTAAVATLKLLNPLLNNDKVRLLLFKSSKTIPKSIDKRFVKFGALDMKKLLILAGNIEETPFVNPEFKSITEIKYQMSDKVFNFNLPLKNLSELTYNGSVCVSSSSEAISIDQNCFEVKDLKAHASKKIVISGKIIDLAQDSHVEFRVNIEEMLYQTSVVFIRDLNNDSDVKNEKIADSRFDDMGIINGDRKFSKMSRVIDKFHRLHYPEYFYIEKKKQTATNTVVTLLTKENGSYLVKDISLPLVVNHVLSIHRQDINRDGKLDFFIYSLSSKKDELIFLNYDNDLNPLFGKYSKWTMKLSTFEGLPIDAGVEKFEWLRLSHPQLGLIIVPSVFKNYGLPDLDNSKIILERIIDARNHYFYLNPKLEVLDDSMKIDLRVLDNVSAMKKLSVDFKLFSDQNIVLLKSIPQTVEESKVGEIKALAALNSGRERKFIELILSTDGIKFKYLEPLYHLDSLVKGGLQNLEDALVYPVISSTNGKNLNEYILTSLLNRSSAEFLTKDDSGISNPLILRQNWENPIIGLLGLFDTESSKSFFIENRSTVTFLSSDGKKSDLPIYRDSAFPGQNFSETLSPIISKGRPGIYVNSTLIYGERLYSMIHTNKGLIRPLELSVGFPDRCLALSPELMDGDEGGVDFNYVFLCTDSNGQASLKFLPISEH